MTLAGCTSCILNFNGGKKSLDAPLLTETLKTAMCWEKNMNLLTNKVCGINEEKKT